MIKNGKIFGKINIFDFIVLVLALLFVFAILAYMGIGVIKDASLTDELILKEANYTITLDSVRKETVDSFEAGMPIYEATDKTQIGIISSIETKDAVVVMETFDGKAVSAPVEGKYDLTLTMRCVVKESANGDLWLTSKDRLLEGRIITFITQKNKCQGAVEDVEITEDLGPLTIKFKSAQENYYNKAEE